MDLGENLADWLLNQIETIPVALLRDKRLQGTRRLYDQLIGEREAAELEALLQQPAAQGERELTVLVPGIMGSLLSSVRGISALLWVNPTVVLDGQLDLLALNVQGTADKSADVQITAVGIEKVFYLNLIITLANQTRLFEFPYDWRYTHERSAEELHGALQRWAAGYPGRKFTLIGHSMGGVVIRTYLALYPAEAEQLVRQVILLASPLQGSPLAAALFSGVSRQQDIAQHLNPANDLVALAGTFPSIYQLLPPPRRMFKANRYYPFNWELYDAKAWGISGLQQHHFDSAVALYRTLAGADPQVPLVQIAGTGVQTLTDIRLDTYGDESAFTPVYQNSGAHSGDNTIPLYSAWDPMTDTYFVKESHQRIPGNASVRQAVLDLVHDRRPALPRVPSAVQEPSLPLVPDILAQPFQELRQRFEKGTFNRDDLARLFWG